MNVQRTALRNIEDILLQNLSVGADDEELRILFPQQLFPFRRDLFRLIDGNPQLFRRPLYGQRNDLFPRLLGRSG